MATMTIKVLEDGNYRVSIYTFTDSTSKQEYMMEDIEVVLADGVTVELDELTTPMTT